ncbi:hypothetical protein [Virgibacillus sp. SK37]|uniref:hypothetical protein n=1 Tax=Virgibacillus sp. SK37 TaxID=403957 RepID=UPI0011A66562|nr:hypothetical protein [Virgibacillus sp. SK37]
MNLNDRIKKERNRVAIDVEQLVKENEADSKNLKELQEDYRKAIFNSNEGEMDKINSQIQEVSVRITRRKIKINELSKNNPIIQKMIMEEITLWVNEISILEKQAADKFKELEPIRKKLLKELIELDKMKHRVNNLRSVTGSYLNQLNDTNKKKIMYDEYASNKVLDSILSLLIERGDVFKVR